MMKVSIVTISYNQGEFIENAIRSVIDQDYGDIEYIVVDAGSKDGSRDTIEEYRDRIDHVIFEPDDGPADGLNKGFAKATGDVFGYVNADDALLPHTLRKVVDFFTRNSGFDVVSAHGHIIDKEGLLLHKVFSHKYNLRGVAAGVCILVQQSTFFRPKIFKQIGGFNKSNRISWDGELMVDYALAGAKFALVHDYWSCFRIYQHSLTGSGNHVEKAKIEHNRIREKIGYKTCVPWAYHLQWLLTRLRDPLTVILRIIDGIKYPKRVIPNDNRVPFFSWEGFQSRH